MMHQVKAQQNDAPRLAREQKTVAAMIHIYCRGRHQCDSGLCRECGELLDYAMRRLERCTFGVDKPACANCPIHCYKPEMRDRIREVMRYAGPRMLPRHPILALRHQLDALKRIAPSGRNSSRRQDT